mmetsp:Transcript_6144/g.10128  ORF Transcript_6144/g.10128 Transcript_6144/m.10128 type:complete len:291 (+) Transcript_6144:946-1818(+)
MIIKPNRTHIRGHLLLFVFFAVIIVIMFIVRAVFLSNTVVVMDESVFALLDGPKTLDQFTQRLGNVIKRTMPSFQCFVCFLHRNSTVRFQQSRAKRVVIAIQQNTNQMRQTHGTASGDRILCFKRTALALQHRFAIMRVHIVIGGLHQQIPLHHIDQLAMAQHLLFEARIRFRHKPVLVLIANVACIFVRSVLEIRPIIIRNSAALLLQTQRHLLVMLQIGQRGDKLVGVVHAVKATQFAVAQLALFQRALDIAARFVHVHILIVVVVVLATTGRVAVDQRIHFVFRLGH